MFGRRRRRLPAYEYEPGIHLLDDVSAPPDVLPPSAAIVAPPSRAKKILIDGDVDPKKVIEFIRRYERFNPR